MKTKSLKVISVLLHYPDQERIDELDEMKQVLLNEGLLKKEHGQLFIHFIEAFKSKTLLEQQEIYVTLFDRTPSLSLHIFEHIHGDSRDRGQAMVDLMALYDKAGYDIESRELPDFIPLFLEYLSLLPKQEALKLLEEPIQVIEALHKRLKLRKSYYGYLFELLIEMLPKKGVKKSNKKSAKSNHEETEMPIDLDESWEEAPAFKPTQVKQGSYNG